MGHNRVVAFILQMHQLAVSLFRMIGALSRTQTIGSTIGCGLTVMCSRCLQENSSHLEHLGSSFPSSAFTQQ